MNPDSIYQKLPHTIQNWLISIFNILAYRKRYGGNYTKYRRLYKTNRSLSLEQLQSIQKQKLEAFLQYSFQNSTYYKKIARKQSNEINLSTLPFLNKEDLRKNIENIVTVDKKEAIISKTGGTTGKSLEVYYTQDDMQNRFAMLDDFRSRYGYELGKKTAWFSGKNLINEKDIRKNRFWKYDSFYKVRYYSTFHIKEDYLKHYILDLIKFKPEYIIGFPSSLKDIAEYGLRNNFEFPKTIKAIFPTAETITPNMREIIELFFKARMYNQYASSEGAPFIFECEKGNLHMELQSGVFEVLDDKNNTSSSGKLILTSFTTHGTPLIRYDIGDALTLSSSFCDCGNNNPLVKEIHGRVDDFLWSIDNGKINLGNISNTLKGVHGLIQFQAIQDELDRIRIYYVIDKSLFTMKDLNNFISNWKDRMGNRMHLDFKEVEVIPNEKSGKYRIIKNNTKHLI